MLIFVVSHGLQGCSFGYHAGGWGKPPVDETGKPLYGDVFGQNLHEVPAPKVSHQIYVHTSSFLHIHHFNVIVYCKKFDYLDMSN